MKTKKRFLSILLTLALVLGLMPGMSFTAYAAEQSVTLKSGTRSSGPINTNLADMMDNLFVTNTPATISASDKVITKLVINKGSLYNTFNASGLSISPGTMSFNSNVLTVTDIDSATVTLRRLTNTNVSISSIVVYYDDPIAVTGVSLNKTSTTLTAGDTETLTATVAPNNATNKSVTWTSSDNNIATVSNGVVTAKAAGTATITVTTNDGNKTATCAVTVESSTVNVTGVSLNKTETTLTVGGTETLTATVEPSNATDKTVVWNAPSYVSLFSDSGCTSPISTGAATSTLTVYAKGTKVGSGSSVTATSNADSEKSASCAVTVNTAGGGTEVTKANVICLQYSYEDADDGTTNTYTLNSAPPTDVVNITLAEAQAFGAAVTCPTTYWVVVYAKDGDSYKWTSNGKTGEQTSSPRGNQGAWTELLYGDVYDFANDPMDEVTFYFSKGLATVAVTGVSLDKTTAQTIDVDGKVSFTATVAPDNATDKTVKWSVGGTDAGAVKLYTDETCTAEVGADVTDKLTVYAKGESAGSATVTATSNADSTKYAECAVTVNDSQVQTEELLTTITATGKEQASYSPEGVATVSFTGQQSYVASWGWWGYGITITVTAAEGYTITKCVFYDNDGATGTDSSGPFVVETTEMDKTPQVNGAIFGRDNGFYSKGITKIEVYGYATPTTTHGVTITPGDNMTKTTDSGAASQTDLSGAMTDVVYTADDGYYFPTDYSVDEVNGITVTRNSYTQITVSGTPTADASITLTAPTAKTTPDAPTTAVAVDCTTADNDDGKLTGVTTAMEYKKSDADSWTDGTGSDITGLASGTYYVRVKATDTTNVSENQELTIKGFVSYAVTFKVVNGSWNEGAGDAATADKTVTLTGHEGDTLKLTAAQIPAVGTKPNDTYKAGSWDVTPSTDAAITEATTYTYTYAAKDSISQTVTFKVVNGSWDDETTADKIVTLTGYEGDTLKLAANQIPAVGTKPNDTYKAGSWNVTPSTDTAITEATTYTYTYAAKEAAVVTKAPEAKTPTYNGQAQELVTAGEATGGEMQYALGTETEATQPYTTSIPAKTDAGTYYVWYKAVGDANHADSAANCIPVSILPKEVTVSGIKADNKVYDRKKDASLSYVDAVVNGKVGNEDLTVSAKGTFSDANAGSGKTVSISNLTLGGADAGNYVLAAKGQQTETTADITAKTVKVSGIKAYDKTYDGKTDATLDYSAAVFDGIVEGNTLTVSTTGTFSDANAGTDKTVNLSDLALGGASAANYVLASEGQQMTAKATIRKAAITITADSKSSAYKKDLLELTYQVSDGYVKGDDLGITLETKASNTAAVGEYDITVDWNKNPNYDAAIVNGKYTITKDSTSISASGYTGTYDGKAHSITVEEVKGSGDTDQVKNIFDGNASEATVYYSSSTELTEQNYESEGTTTNPSFTNVGTYTVYYFVASKNYEPNPMKGSATVTITKASLTVTAKDNTITYGDAPAANGVTYNGFVNGETESVVSGTPAYTYSYAQYGNVGEYAITPVVTGLSADNYTFTAADGKLTVGQKDITFTWPNEADSSLTYTGSEQNITATANTVNNDVLDLTYTDNEKTDAGNYTAKVTAISGDKAKNYNLKADEPTASHAWKINKAKLTLKADDKSSVYGEALAALAYSVKEGSISDGYDLKVDLATTAVQGSDAGTYDITGTCTDANYDVTVEKGIYTVTPAEITITADDKSSAYKADLQELTYQVSSSYVEGDDLGITLATEASSTAKVGTYPITVSWNENKNYTATITDGTYTITQDGASISVTGYSGVYDGKAHSITVEEVKGSAADAVKNIFGGDTPEATVYYGTEELTADNYQTAGSTTNPAYTNAGEYTVYYFVESGNYTVQPISGSKTVSITKAPLAITAQDNTITYGDVPADNGVTYEGFIGTEDESVLGGTLTCTCDYEQYGDVGEYAITPAGLTSDNYAITFTAGKLTIVPKEIGISALTVDPSEVRGTASKTGPKFTVKDGGRVLTEGTDYDLSGETTSDEFGTHFVTVTAKGNYTGSFDTSWKLVRKDNRVFSKQEGNSFIEASVNVDEDVPAIVVENLTTDLAKNLLTKEENARYEAGEKVSVYLEVETLDASEVPAADKSLAEKKVKELGGKIGIFLDLSLWKKIGNDSATQVHDTNGKAIKVTVTIPENLRNTNESIERTFQIIRIHNGKAEVLASSTSDTITFETELFSTYTLSYTDKTIEKKTAGASKGTDDTKKTVTQSNGPKTGDNSQMYLWIVLIAAAAAGLGGMTVYGRKKRHL